MKKAISYLCLSTSLFLMRLSTLQAIDSNSTLSKCTKEELMTFFPEQVVESVLIQANLPKEKASAIAQELSQKDRTLAKIVEEKAAKLEPNPFKDLSQRDLAIKIYRETLYEIFAKVLKSHGVTNEDQIQSLLEEMNAAKSKLFIDCIRKQQQQIAPNEAPSSGGQVSVP